MWNFIIKIRPLIVPMMVLFGYGVFIIMVFYQEKW